MNLNQVQLIGRITRDPELRAMPSGSAVVKFGLATNYSYKDKNQQKVETTQFHNCVCFGPLAEKVIAPYAKKGQEVFLQGRIEYREWDKKDGSGKGYQTEIIVEDFQLGAKARGGSESQDTGYQEPAVQVEGGGEINPEDIPF